jgi:hypothetical protein
MACTGASNAILCRWVSLEKKTYTKLVRGSNWPLTFAPDPVLGHQSRGIPSTWMKCALSAHTCNILHCAYRAHFGLAQLTDQPQRWNEDHEGFGHRRVVLVVLVMIDPLACYVRRALCVSLRQLRA